MMVHASMPDGLDGPTLWAVRLGKDSQTFGSTQLCRGEFGFVGWEGLMKVAVGMSRGFQGLGIFRIFSRLCWLFCSEWFWKSWNGMVATLRDLESVDQSWLLWKNTSTPQWKDSYVLSSYELVWSFDLIGTWIATLQMQCVSHTPRRCGTRLTSIQSLPQRMDQWRIWSRG